MSQSNPYEPPRSQVADVEESTEWGEFLDGGRSVGVEQGWAWLASGFDLLRRRLGTWVGMTIVFVLIFFGLGMVPIVGLVISLLVPVFIAGMLIGCRDLEREGSFGVRHLFAAFGGMAGRLVLLGVLNGLLWMVLATVGVLIMWKAFAGFLASRDPAAIVAAGPEVLIALLVVLGLSVPIMMAWWFAPGLVVFNQFGPARAMSQSFRACLKNIMPFLLYGVLLFILFVLASIPFGLGLLVAFPLTVTSTYAAYRDIFYVPA